MGSTAHLCACWVPGCGNHLFPRWYQDIGLALFPLTDQLMGIDLGCLSAPFLSLNMVRLHRGMVSVCPAAWAFLQLIKTGHDLSVASVLPFTLWPLEKEH